MTNKKLSEQMTLFRTSNGYTQKYVSDHLHITRSAYSNYERGHRTPSLEILASLAELYNIPPFVFLQTLDVNSCFPSNEDIRILNILHELPKEIQNDILDYALFKKERYCV